MTCTAASLLAEAKCYHCIPKGLRRTILLSLLCQWAAKRKGGGK
jgi:hypothetical protein